MADPSYRWSHADTRGLGAAVESGIARATLKQWDRGAITGEFGSDVLTSTLRAPGQERDFRAFMFASYFMYCELSMRPAEMRTDKTTGVPEIVLERRSDSEFSSAERMDWVHQATMHTFGRLGLRLVLIMGGNPEIDVPKIEPTVITIDGEAPMMPTVKGGAGAAWVLPAFGMLLGAATACFLIERAAMLIDRDLARHADAAAMLASQAQMVNVLNTHREAEKSAGHELPLTDAERGVLSQLAGLQKIYSDNTNKGGPFPSVLPSGSDIGETVKSWGIGALVVLAGIAYLAMKGR